ncbi:hypothetical protein ACFQ0D_35735, partial [Micromonospora zhanjiangensis]
APATGTGTSSTGTGPAGVPSTVGLCRAYLAKGAADRGKALQTPAYRTLVTAAGGADKVYAYCAAVVLAPAERPRPSASHSRAPAAEQNDRVNPNAKKTPE